MTNKRKICHCIAMTFSEHRVGKRYEDFARIEAPGLCVLPGVLVNISKTGCRVRFPIPVESSKNSLCELNIQPCCKAGLKPFSVTAKQVWKDSEAPASELGFSFVNSMEPLKLKSYLDVLSESSLDPEEELLQELCL